jgi:hypothetical protein
MGAFAYELFLWKQREKRRAYQKDYQKRRRFEKQQDAARKQQRMLDDIHEFQYSGPRLEAKRRYMQQETESQEDVMEWSRKTWNTIPCNHLAMPLFNGFDSGEEIDILLILSRGEQKNVEKVIKRR